MVVLGSKSWDSPHVGPGKKLKVLELSTQGALGMGFVMALSKNRVPKFWCFINFTMICWPVQICLGRH
jgi:hypothetical protein